MKSEEKRSIYMKATNTFVQTELCWAVPISLGVPPLPCPSTPWSAPWWLRTETNSRNNKKTKFRTKHFEIEFHSLLINYTFRLQFSLKIFKVNFLPAWLSIRFQYWEGRGRATPSWPSLPSSCRAWHLTASSCESLKNKKFNGLYQQLLKKLT